MAVLARAVSLLAFLPDPLHDGDIMAAEIRLFPCLTDNFGYLIHDPITRATASIDAPEAAASDTNTACV